MDKSGTFTKCTEEKEHSEALLQDKQLLIGLGEKLKLLQSMKGHDEQEKKALRAENVRLVSDNVELQGQLHEQQALSVRLQETVDDLQKQIIEIKMNSNEGHGVQEKKKDEESTDDEKEESTDEEEEEEELMEKNLGTQGKKFKCTGCAYRSASRGNLKVHMRTHTGNKPHKCTICGYRAA